MTDHLLREDCGYQLLYTKQLNQEQCEGPVGRKGLKKGALLRAVSGGGAGPDEVVLWKRLQGFWLCVAYLLPGS